MRAWWLVLLAVGMFARPVRADGNFEAYAVVIGSNEGGEGQHRLAHAQSDAQRMAQLLGELGRVPREHLTLLREPTAKSVQAALQALRTRLEAERAAGKQTQVLFYYSGHARSQGLSLGREELSLHELREALVGLPSTLTVVVLDACQSGAFSGVKGARPAADFSLSSVHDLNSRGVAVLSSSTGSEFSQESAELEGSYFTHHLTVALRGPGDFDANGRVSLDEAYRYAYDHTLADTARTQVGTQHATFESNLAGRGEIALTYPGDSDALLVLPPEASGRVLVQRMPGGAVVAELVKAQGAPLGIAVPSGSYQLLLREQLESRRARECQLAVGHKQAGTLVLSDCRHVELRDPERKGTVKEEPYERWFFELGMAGRSQHQDGYIHRLEEFRFQPSLRALRLDNGSQHLFVDTAMGVAVHPNVSVVLRYDVFARRSFDRDLTGPNMLTDNTQFSWRTVAPSVGARGRLRLLDEWIVGFVELTIGLAISRSEYQATDVGDWQHKFGPALRAAGGFTFGFTEHFGMYLNGGYAIVPALRNDLGDRHDDGGFFGAFGLRMRAVKGWW